MILKQATMKLAKIKDGVEGHHNKLVLLWKEVGLCIHKNMGMSNIKGYTISHYNSGKIILSGIVTRQEAEEYMEDLVKVLPDWRFTEEEWKEYPPTDKGLIKVEVDTLQKEIHEKATICKTNIISHGK